MTAPFDGADDPADSNEETSPGSAVRSVPWKLIGELLGAAAALAAVATLLLEIWPLRDEGDRDTASPTPATQGPSQTAPGSAASEALGPGDCLDASLNAMARCDVPHEYEVFASDDCSDASLITYLGGDPAVDIVRAIPQRVEVASGFTCVVSPPERAPHDSAAEGVLQGPIDDAWRSCIDDRTGEQDMSCADQHTGEWVSREPEADEMVNCEELAARYMNAPPSRFSGRLQVGAARGPAGPRCFVEILGSDLLHGSVRSIGVSSLPTR
jgi:hypothetical protein